MKEEERLKKEKQDMLGFYDYTVVLTYISLVISVFGMTRALAGDFKVAILCLALSGLCDMFDGKIARTKKDRTEDEKKFGIQIDSLCDVVCFGVFPALICYCLGMDRIPGIIILCLYCVASVIRLGYFNVMEEKRQNEVQRHSQRCGENGGKNPGSYLGGGASGSAIAACQYDIVDSLILA